MVSSRENEILQMEQAIDLIAERLDQLVKAKQIVRRIEEGEMFVFARGSKKTEKEGRNQSANQQRQQEEGYGL